MYSPSSEYFIICDSGSESVVTSGDVKILYLVCSRISYPLLQFDA